MICGARAFVNVGRVRCVSASKGERPPIASYQSFRGGHVVCGAVSSNAERPNLMMGAERGGGQLSAWKEAAAALLSTIQV